MAMRCPRNSTYGSERRRRQAGINRSTILSNASWPCRPPPVHHRLPRLQQKVTRTEKHPTGARAGERLVQPGEKTTHLPHGVPFQCHSWIRSQVQVTLTAEIRPAGDETQFKTTVYNYPLLDWWCRIRLRYQQLHHWGFPLTLQAPHVWWHETQRRAP